MVLKELPIFMYFISRLRFFLLNINIVAIVQWKSRLISIFGMLHHWQVMRDVSLPSGQPVPIVVKF
jgi:hypothetical protein